MFKFIPLDSRTSEEVNDYFEYQKHIKEEMSNALGIPKELIYGKSINKKSNFKNFLIRLWKKITFQKH